MKIIIIEENTHFRANLKLDLAGIGIEKIKTCSNSNSAIAYIHEENPNLVILSSTIKNGALDNSFPLFLHKKNIPFIYLTPNADKETFTLLQKNNPKAILMRSYRIIELKSILDLIIYKEHSPTNNIAYTDNACYILKEFNYFFIKNNSILKKITLDELIFVESNKNYVALYTDKNKYLLRRKLSYFSEYLPKNFYKINKSNIININYIHEIDGHMVRLNTIPKRLIIASTYLVDFKNQLPIL